MPTNDHKTIHQHSGAKYLRLIHAAGPLPEGGGMTKVMVDVYAVLVAFDVRCPAIQHAIKKLLCAGIRDKGTRIQDISEAIDALYRSIELERDRVRNDESSQSESDTSRTHCD